MLFQTSEIQEDNLNVQADAMRLISNPKISMQIGLEAKALKKTIGELSENEICIYVSNGAWGTPQMVAYFIDLYGKSDLYLTTWSIGNDAIEKLKRLINAGLIGKFVVRLDERIQKLNPHAFHVLSALPDKLIFSRIHAKVIVLESKNMSLSIVTSANFTRNPREECGTIFTQKEVANFLKEWIQTEKLKA